MHQNNQNYDKIYIFLKESSQILYLIYEKESKTVYNK